LGHSVPSLHWWLTLNASDQGIWFSGIATLLAVIVALLVAFREVINRRAERKFASKMLAMHLLPVLIQMSHKLRKIVESLELIDPDGRLNYFRQNIAPLSRRIENLSPESLVEAFADRNAALPKKGTERLARTYGLLVSSKYVLSMAASDEKAEMGKFYVLYRLLVISRYHINDVKNLCQEINRESGALTGEPPKKTVEEFFGTANQNGEPAKTGSGSLSKGRK